MEADCRPSRQAPPKAPPRAEPPVPAARACWPTTPASCAARSRTRCWSTCRRCRRRSWATAAEAFLAPAHGTRLARRHAGRSPRRRWPSCRIRCWRRCSGPDSRAEVPHRRRAAPSRRHRPGAAPDRQDRPPGDDARESVLIVDYKTNRPPPADAARCPRPTCFQLAAYRLAVSRDFPQAAGARPPSCGPTARASWRLPGALLDAYQHRLWQLDPGQP